MVWRGANPAYCGSAGVVRVLYNTTIRRGNAAVIERALVASLQSRVWQARWAGGLWCVLHQSLWCVYILGRYCPSCNASLTLHIVSAVTSVRFIEGTTSRPTFSASSATFGQLSDLFWPVSAGVQHHP